MAKPPVKKPVKEQPIKEKTGREKALEFAKNVPKPKLKPSSATDGATTSGETTNDEH